MLASLAGQLGFKPNLLANILAGKLAGLDAVADPYWRQVAGDCSAQEVEELL